MIHKFGIFHTIEELNRAAAAQKAEGDEEALKALASENGIDIEDAQDYLDGLVDVLATPIMAAIGKLNLEAGELLLKSQLVDWKNYIIMFCSENEELCRAVFDPNKNLLDVLAEAIKFASKNRIKVPDAIAKKAGINSPTYIGMTSKEDLRQIVNEYYLGGVK